jgi:PAS domain S-box-containing protein
VDQRAGLAPVTLERAGKASRPEQDLASAILDTAGALIVVLDAEGRIVLFNQACERTTGYSQDEVVGKCVWDLFLVPEEAEEVSAVFAQLRSGAYPNEHENVWVTREGDHRLISWSNTALLSEKGQVAYVVGTGIDVTEQRRADAALQQLTRDLGERIKELDCLYAISALVERRGTTVEETVQGTVDLVPPAFQYPNRVGAQIVLGEQEFSTENYRETTWQQIRDIWVGGRRAGHIQVCYLGDWREKGEGPFLREEESLISAIAERLSGILERMQAQEALRRSEERYALAQRAAHIGSWDWDIPSGDLRWSEEIEPMFGFGPGEFAATYDAFLARVHPEDREYVTGSVNASVQRGAGYAIEHRIVWPDGTVRWVSETGDVIHDREGRAIRMLGVVQDITARKQAEEQIRQQNAFLTSVLESLTHPFYVVRVADHTVEMANTAARESSVPGRATCYALFHGRSRPCGEDGAVCPLEEIKRTKRPLTVEHVHYDADGRARNIEVRCYPLFDDEGDVTRVIEYSLDVTQRKQAEERLRQSEARWRSVTENSPDHVILLDRDLNIQFVNYASPGMTVEELIGTPLWAYVSEEKQTGIKQILQTVLVTKEPRSYQTEFLTPDGETIYYESRVVARILDDQVIGLAINARDITAHEQAEQALREAKEAAEQARREEQERRQEADRRRRIAESLAGILAALNSDQPLTLILDDIAAHAKELLGNQAVAIIRLEDENGTLVQQAAQGLPVDSAAAIDKLPGAAALREAVVSRQAIPIPDLAAGSADGTPAEPFGALLAIPVVIQEKGYGAIGLYYADPRSFSHEEMELAAVFGDQVALAVGNARLKEQAQQAAVAAERSRLARDLHDSVTQALFSAGLVAEVLPEVWRRDPQGAQQGLEELRLLTRGALAEMRTLLLELRPTGVVETALDDLLEQLTDAATGRAQLSVALDIEPCPILPPDVHVTFYRVAQEALNNVVKHAEASHVTVNLRASPPAGPERAGPWQGKVVLCVIDDGRGFAPGQVGPGQIGLEIMRERAATVGGRLDIEGRPGNGTQVTLVWESTPS